MLGCLRDHDAGAWGSGGVTQLVRWFTGLRLARRPVIAWLIAPCACATRLVETRQGVGSFVLRTGPAPRPVEVLAGRRPVTAAPYGSCAACARGNGPICAAIWGAAGGWRRAEAPAGVVEQGILLPGRGRRGARSCRPAASRYRSAHAWGPTHPATDESAWVPGHDVTLSPSIVGSIARRRGGAHGSAGRGRVISPRCWSLHQ